jgi:hypothetical protein
VAGDLNKVGMKKSDLLTKRFNLTPALDSSQATHKKGGHLDIIWTNLEISGKEIIEGLNEITDCVVIIVN